MWSVVSISEGGSAKGVGERSRSLGRILARRRDFCRPRAGEPRKSNALSPQLLAMNSSSAGDHTLLTASGATIATAVAPESSLASRFEGSIRWQASAEAGGISAA